MEKKLYTLYKSTLSNKKYDVYIENKTGRIKKVSFGAKGYSDFTIHKDKKRRERYRTRHQNDNINDPSSSGFWSWYALWGSSSNLDTAFADAVKKAKKILKH